MINNKKFDKKEKLKKVFIRAMTAGGNIVKKGHNSYLCFIKKDSKSLAKAEAERVAREKRETAQRKKEEELHEKREIARIHLLKSKRKAMHIGH